MATIIRHSAIKNWRNQSSYQYLLPIRYQKIRLNHTSINKTISISSKEHNEQRKRKFSQSIGSPQICVLAGIISILLVAADQPNLKTEGNKQQTNLKSKDNQQPRFSKDKDVSLLCLIGLPQSGKSLQAKNIEERWKEWKVLNNIDSVESLLNAIEKEKNSNSNKRLNLIIDGFPKSLDQAKEIEKEIVEIFCYAFFGMEKQEWINRTGKSEKDFDKISNSLKSLREFPREKGNILEIAAAWPKNEVWEMVEAKVEQIFELREMGEL